MFLCLYSCKTKKVTTTIYSTIGYLEKNSPEFSKYVPEGVVIEIIASGHNWTEGPVWSSKEKCLIYSDVPKNIAYKWTEEAGAIPYLNPSGYSGEKPRKGGKGSNGLAIDYQNNLILCRSGDREIAAMVASLGNPESNYKTIASKYNGKRFNSPNDLVIDKKGNIYFTDPYFGLPKDKREELNELGFQGVYKIDKEDNGVHLLTNDWSEPNGIGLSPNNKTLYITNTRPAKLIAFDIVNEVDLRNQRVIFNAETLVKSSISKQGPDGIAINKDGVIFMAGPDGVLVITPEGKHLGTIRTNKRTSNCVFNEDETVLYITSDDMVLRVVLK